MKSQRHQWHGASSAMVELLLFPSTTPSYLSTFPIVPKKQQQSKKSPCLLVYSPSSRAIFSMLSSSRPFICAQPVRPGLISFAPYLSRSSIRSYWFQSAGRGPIMLILPVNICAICGNSSILVLRKILPTRVIYLSGSSNICVGVSCGVSIRIVRNFTILK